MQKKFAQLTLLAICLAAPFAGCGSSGSTSDSRSGASTSPAAETATTTEEEVIPPGGPAPQALIRVRQVPGLGRVLVDSANKTLYRFSKDTRGGRTSHCYDACVRLWYPEASYTPPAAGSPELDASEFGVFMRKDGYRQATYYGWPLYTLITEYSRKKTGVGKSSFGGTWYALRANGESVK